MAHFDKFNKQIEARLAAQGSRFMAGERITIADFVIFSLYMALVQNENSGAPEVQAALAATLTDSEKVNEYLAMMKIEMGSYMAVRSPYGV